MSNRTTDERDVDERRDVDDDVGPNPSERGKWVSALIGLLGLWMLVEAVWLNLVPGQFWNDVIVGALLLAVGGYNYFRRANEQIGSVAAAAIAALVGLWLVVAPFLLGPDAGVTDTANVLGFWNDVIVGVIALVLGAYSAYEAREGRSRTTTVRG